MADCAVAVEQHRVGKAHRMPRHTEAVPGMSMVPGILRLANCLESELGFTNRS